MGITYGYCDLPTLKADLDMEKPTNDTLLELAIEGASRFIDGETGRRFYAIAGEVRLFTATCRTELYVGDFVTLTQIRTDEDGDRTYENTFDIAGADADVDFEPYNNQFEGEPYWKLCTTPNADYSFPVGIRRGVELTGSFGFCATGAHPTKITVACLRLAARYYKRHETPSSGITMPDAVAVGVWSRLLDPEVRDILDHYRLITVA